MITENQVMIDLIGFINAALKKLNVTGWSVLQSFQPTKGNYPQPYILVHKLSNTFVGQLQQNSVDSTKSGQLKQATFQIEAYKKRLPTDTYQTLTGGDVLEYVRNWFMGDAAQKALRAKGYNVLRVDGIVNPQFETETDTWQISPNFTLDLMYKQTYSEETSSITSADGILIGI